MADVDSLASSSSSDDEDFLTMTSGSNPGDQTVDREALVRKKLLENFYGKSAVAAAAPEEDDDDSDDDEGISEGSSSNDISSQRVRGKGGRKNITDLDSPDFDAAAFTRKHIRESSIHTLLETEERLALQVRTLDSTMQTLVYENYSRFIDATDAIKSIGVNVQANEEGLVRLTTSMQSIDANARTVEDAIGSLRDEVAEKIRVKRLLGRLETLLKLPTTLSSQIAAGKYRQATKAYLSASSILSKHSQGFESLLNIETECQELLRNLKATLKRKILHWSGSVSMTWDDPVEDEEGPETAAEAAEAPIPKAPKNMAEIFECAGTLYIVLESSNDTEEGDLTAEDLQSKAVSACMRSLDRLLDAHLIAVQERHFSIVPGAEEMIGRTGSSEEINGISSKATVAQGAKGAYLVPQEFLDALLQAATLYGMSFGSDECSTTYVKELVSEGYSSFLSHMRSVLLEESASSPAHLTVESSPSADEEEAADDNHEDISGGLSQLVQSVRGFSSGIALADVGLSPDYISSLVEQVTALTESMLRRRVDEKFYELRMRVVRDCLVNFADRVIEQKVAVETATTELTQEGDGSKPLLVVEVSRIANSTLSDCLQLVDDAIRSVLSENQSQGDESSDLPILKEAVESSTKRFSWWLANVFEFLAGGEMLSKNSIVEATQLVVTTEEEKAEMKRNNAQAARMSEWDNNNNDYPDQDDTIIKMVHSVRDKFGVDQNGEVPTDFVLIIAELCRLAEGSIADNLDQSIMTHLGSSSGKRKSRGLFPTDEPFSLGTRKGGETNDTTLRFQLAESRILSVYGISLGTLVGNTICRDLHSLRNELDEVYAGPRSCMWEALGVVKNVSLSVAEMFGQSPQAGQLPAVEDIAMGGDFASSLMSRKSGLMLNVERMFNDSVLIYPHPSEILDFSRDSLVFLVLRVAFRVLIEKTRMVILSSSGYKQLFLDIEFLKFMIPHYVDKDYTMNSANATSALVGLLSDATAAAGERCVDEDTVEDDETRHAAISALRSFMSLLDEDISQQFILDDPLPS